MVKKCGEIWRDEVDEETKAKYKTLYKDRLERNSRFDKKVASTSPMDVESSVVEKLEDMNLSFEEDVDENPLLSLIQKMVINVLEGKCVVVLRLLK